MMEWTEWMGIAATIGAGVLGFLKFLQSQRVDAVSAQSGVASNHRAGIEQVIQGYDLLLNQAQETIKDDQEVKKLLEARIEKFIDDLQACRVENNRLRRKYGNGDNGNGTPVPPINPLK